MKKSLAILLVLLVLSAFPAMAEESAYRIGVCQLVQHAALDDSTQGFVDTLQAELGDRVEIIVKNASGDIPTCTAIMNSFLAEEVDLILANATPALQAAHAATGDIPILGTSVSDYAAALDFDQWTGVTGMNISGTSDLAPLDAQAAILEELFPDAEKVGLLYCSSEANSIYQVNIISGLLSEMGYQCTQFAFTDTNDVYSVTQSACAESDVLYAPTDNTVASCAELIRNVVEMENTPVIGGDEGICAGCGVATLCVSYYDLGCATAEMALEILEGGTDISTMPVRFAPRFYKVYNDELCSYLSITTPGDYQRVRQ